MSLDPFLSTRPSASEGRQPSLRMSAGQLGMILFLASLAMVFGASLLGYVITRLQSPMWRTPGSPDLPGGLWASTVLLLLVSVSLEWALHSVRRNRLQSLSRALFSTFALGLAFLLSQGLNWTQMAALQPQPPRSLYGFTFYLLTGLHALHVVGGFVPLGIVWNRARRSEYTSSRYEGLKFCVQYWHFLGGVWVVLLAALLLLS